MNSIPLLEARDLRKGFPGVQALDGVGVQVSAGEVLAVVGENGAGKSTLMKILAGVYQPDAGAIFLDGQPLHVTGVSDALERGIVLIHQELNMAGPLSVCANLFLGRERRKGGVFLDRRSMAVEGLKLLNRVGLDVPCFRRVPRAMHMDVCPVDLMDLEDFSGARMQGLDENTKIMGDVACRIAVRRFQIAWIAEVE